ncbi:unnamed protein product [Eruca vesicaria subsp. sativa]|uniref:Cytochrome P450 n=1 Tax=Eruca vesicaria subsp. sativa TaxID=29727 RepID=A0ABC8KL34_ERUVS|nr:unnamed protein product [Eruca vesicaria subsp. sativa]
MTMISAGHETTAAVFTWAANLLAQNPEKNRKAQAEIYTVLGEGAPIYKSLKKQESVHTTHHCRIPSSISFLIFIVMYGKTEPQGFNWRFQNLLENLKSEVVWT